MSAADVKPFKRSGLHRLECPMCPCYGYFTVAMLENAGQLPSCFAKDCGAELVPATIGLAMLLGMDDAPVVQEYERRTDDKIRSQTRAVGGWQKALTRQGQGTLNRMDASAYAEIVREQSQQARERRLSALRAPVEAIPF